MPLILMLFFGGVGHYLTWKAWKGGGPTTEVWWSIIFTDWAQLSSARLNHLLAVQMPTTWRYSGTNKECEIPPPIVENPRRNTRPEGHFRHSKDWSYYLHERGSLFWCPRRFLSIPLRCLEMYDLCDIFSISESSHKAPPHRFCQLGVSAFLVLTFPDEITLPGRPQLASASSLGQPRGVRIMTLPRIFRQLWKKDSMPHLVPSITFWARQGKAGKALKYRVTITTLSTPWMLLLGKIGRGSTMPISVVAMIRYLDVPID